MKRIVVDANILVRAVLGKRVLALLKKYEDSAVFYNPEICFDDARHYIPELAAKGGLDPEACFVVLRQVGHLV